MTKSSLDGELIGDYTEEDRERMNKDGHAIVVCGCPSGPYIGARKSGTPDCCERCGFMTQDQFDAIAVRILGEAADDLSLEHRTRSADFTAERYGDDLWGTGTIQEWLRSRVKIKDTP